MDFSLSDEQRMLQDTVGKFVADRYSLDQRKDYMAQSAGHDAGVANELADLGLNLVQIAEEQGGLGGDAFDAMIVGEALGPGLVLEPVMDVMTAVSALAGGREDILEDSNAHTLGLYERGQRYSLMPAGTTVAGGKITGTKTLAPISAGATHALVSAKDGDDVGLYRVSLSAEGSTVFNYPLQDGRPFADLQFDGVEAERIDGVGLAEIEAAVARLAIAECAVAVGAMQAALDMTKEYLTVRKQFGRPLAAFQELQFRLVDMNMEVQDARSMSIWAANQANLASGNELLRAASLAKAKITHLLMQIIDAQIMR